jgi:putative aldouronate transport system substrate-binding protein
MKKNLFVVLGVLMIGLPLSAGGRGQNTPGGSGAAAAENTLTFATHEGWYSAVTLNDNLEIWREIEKKTGIKIQWQAASNYDAAMNPVIASGAKLPDIMMIPGGYNPGQLGADGVILELDNLIAGHGPDIQNMFNRYPNLKAAFTAPDGKIYTIAHTAIFVNDMVLQDHLFIRKDWLDKLNLRVPSTIDEWYTVLKAFRDNDPNGNGRRDEVPFGWGSPAPTAFGSAFGLPVGFTDWWYDSSGRVFYVYTSPQYKQFLQTMNQWYKEGLLDQELGRDEANMASLMATNVVGSLQQLSERQNQNNGYVRPADPNVNYILVDPPATPDGSPLRILKRNDIWYHYGITKDCKNPELAMKWINYVWGTEEGADLQVFGIEGKTYTAANGKKSFTDYVLRNPDGLDPFNALRALGGVDDILGRPSAEFYEALMVESPDVIAAGRKFLPNRVPQFWEIQLSDAQQNTWNRVNADFSTYSSEMRTKFVIGETPLSEWDNYVRTLNSIGLAELQAIRQYQYNKFYNK